MRHAVIVLALVALACGPSKAERAAQDCQTLHASALWASATETCANAVRLNQADTASLARYAEALARKHPTNPIAAISGIDPGLHPDVLSVVNAAIDRVSSESAAQSAATADALNRTDMAARQARALERAANALERTAEQR